MNVVMITSDGFWTIGLIDGKASVWQGNMRKPKNTGEVDFASEGQQFEPGDGSIYIATLDGDELDWVELDE